MTVRLALSVLAATTLLSACAGRLLPTAATPEVKDRREVAVAVTTSHQLISFNAATPGKLLWKRSLTGLQAGEVILGIDYRQKNDTLYALGSSGRLYTVDTDTGALTPVGAPLAVPLQGTEFGFDFNPTVDRIRVASSTGQNLRLHPDTGAVVDSNADMAGVQTDGPLAFVPGDPNAARGARVVAAAYSYNKVDSKITTNYAIDQISASLVTQGTREGVAPMVSPNTGRLMTVGALNVGPFETAAFDIHVLTDEGFAALSGRDGTVSRWIQIDLKTGAGRIIGTIAGGEGVRAIAFESF
jgi:hypothetical protein